MRRNSSSCECQRPSEQHTTSVCGRSLLHGCVATTSFGLGANRAWSSARTSADWLCHDVTRFMTRPFPRDRGSVRSISVLSPAPRSQSRSSRSCGEARSSNDCAKERHGRRHRVVQWPQIVRRFMAQREQNPCGKIQFTRKNTESNFSQRVSTDSETRPSRAERGLAITSAASPQCWNRNSFEFRIAQPTSSRAWRRSD